MIRKKLSFISMIVFMTVFSLAAIFDIRTPIHNDKSKESKSDKVAIATSDNLAKKTQQIKIHSFSNDSEVEDNSDDSAQPSNLPLEENTSITPAIGNTDETALPTIVPTSIPTPTPVVTEAPKQKYANIGISIAKDFVHIRVKPSTKSESVGKLYRNSAAEILKTKDGWFYVESGSVKGYIKCDLLKTGLSDETLIKKYGTPSARVNVDGLNVRKDPDMDSKKITTIYQDETYRVLETKGDWIKIDLEDEKINGYVKKEFVELEAEFKDAISKKQEEKILQLKAEKRLKKQTTIKHGNGFNYTDDDLKLLVCLIQAEAGHQSYECKLAVANVVLNRVKLHKASFKAIIYSPGQFSVAKSGSLQKQLNRFDNFSNQAELLTIKAAKDALSGSNNIGTRRFFHSYAAAVRKGYDKKSTAVKLGGLVFW